MSFTARPPFASGMQNSGQNQQQQGQSNTSNVAPGAVPNLSMINNPATNSVQPNNYSASPASSSSVMFEHQKLMQQQLLVQTQLLLQQQQQQQKQQSAQTQQANFQHQTNPQQAALSRLVSEIQKNGGSSLAQQQQQLQQFVQMSALGMLSQAAQQGLLHQQKTFQQQAVPLPSNTTITPVGRQNVQLTQKQPTNYPRSNAVNKNVPQSMSPAQSRNKNAPTLTAKPSIPTIPPGISPSLNISTVAPKGYSDNYAARQAAAANITPSLTITKTSSPSSSSQMAKSGSGLVNRPIGSNVATANISSLQKPLIPEAISMSLANALSAKTTQAPSVSLTPAHKLNVLPTIKSTPMTPQRLNVPPAVANIQKLSPTSPRLKQTPRKNMNPIKTSLSPGALPTSVQSVVPRTDMKTETKTVSSAVLTNVPVFTGSTASAMKPVTKNNVPVAKPLINASPSTNTAQMKQESVKPVVSSPVKIESAKKEPIAVKSEPKNDKALNLPLKKESEPSPNGSIPPKVQNIPKPNIKSETPVKVPITVESEKKPADNDKNKTIKAVSDTTQVKPVKGETAQKQTSKVADQPIETKPKELKEAVKSNNKAPSTPVNTKTPVSKANVASTSTPVPSSVEVRAKRNRLKTIPYQSPTPEIELVSKISAIEASNLNRNTEEKLTLFYKNEFLAVRNADGGFFLCQTINNIYKTSPKIRIRWLSEEPTNQNIYGLDFYDSTDLECVLTSVSLTKMSKGKFELSKAERERIENILKRALDVEKGVVTRPEVTEENPDGLDFSLYTDESQIEKKSPAKRKSNDRSQSVQQSASSASKRKSTSTASDETPQKKVKQSAKNSLSSKTSVTKKSPVESAKKSAGSKSAKAKIMTVESTPTSKRTATKRKLIDEEKTDNTDTKKDEEPSKDDESQTKNKEIESPKEVAEKATPADGSPNNQSGRTVRRSRN